MRKIIKGRKMPWSARIEETLSIAIAICAHGQMQNGTAVVKQQLSRIILIIPHHHLLLKTHDDRE
jgi:hypothetical protein